MNHGNDFICFWSLRKSLRKKWVCRAPVNSSAAQTQWGPRLGSLERDSSLRGTCLLIQRSPTKTWKSRARAAERRPRSTDASAASRRAGAPAHSQFVYKALSEYDFARGASEGRSEQRGRLSHPFCTQKRFPTHSTVALTSLERFNVLSPPFSVVFFNIKWVMGRHQLEWPTRRMGPSVSS